MTPLRILIVGAGIAGLAAKRALALRGIDADIAERDRTPRITGAGLYLPANAVRALRDLGLGAPLAERAQPVLRQELRDERGQVLAGFPVSAIWGSVGDCLAIRRTDLHSLLLEAVGSAAVRFGTGVREVGRDGRVTFTDGRQSGYDLVIGADGLNSVVRRTALTAARPRYLDQVTWRFLAPAAGPPQDTWTVMLGSRGRTFLTVPVGGGQLYCSAAMDSTDPDRIPADWRSHFADFGAPATDLLAHAGQAHYAPLYEVRAFEQHHPHAVLIGDAAHACSPSMSQASGMAVEDALVLAETLAEAPAGTSVEAALAAYRKRRGDRVRFDRQPDADPFHVIAEMYAVVTMIKVVDGMTLQVPVPDQDDPIWTAANGFVVQPEEGVHKLLNGGQESVMVKVTSAQTGGRLSLLEIDVTPGFGNNAHAHGGEVEAFYIASGNFRFINGAGTFDAGAGAFVYVPRGTRHGFRNIGSEAGRLMVFYTPAGAEQFFLDNGDDPDPDGNPPPEWMQERFDAMAEALKAHKMILSPKSDDWA